MMEEQVYTIQELMPKFRELNAVYTTIIQRGDIFYSEQVLVMKFYKAFQEITLFERALIELMLATDKEKYRVLTTNLQSEIAKNIFHYEAYQQFLKTLDIYAVCRENVSFYNQAIKDRLQVTNEYGKELTELKNALDNAEWNGRTEEENILQRKINQTQPLYEEEKKKLDALFARQRETELETAQYSSNLFPEMYVLDKVMLSILESYLTKEESIQEKKSSVTTGGNMTYFDMKLMAAIYEQCNARQFENAPDTKYYSFFNLHSTETPLKILPGEKTRVYYLLHRLYESLSLETKLHWRDSIFQLLGIDENVYQSKYREPVSSNPPAKSKRFAENLDDIFALYVK